MTTIALPAQSVVLIVGGKRAPYAEMADRIPNSIAAPWDVMKPKIAQPLLQEAVSKKGIVRVCMPNSNAKARRTVSSTARKQGAVAICIRLPGYPEFNPVEERYDATYDIDDVNDVTFEIQRMPTDRSDLTGPFDMVGDVHGCADELLDLMVKLGHADEGRNPIRHAEGRILVLLGDLTDRGPDSRRVLQIARQVEGLGNIVIKGNHDEKLLKWLVGKPVEIKSGLETTVAELADTSPAWRQDLAVWINSLPTHLMLDGGRLAIAHAGIDERNQGVQTTEAMNFAMYGKPIDGGTTLDEDGYPLRDDWALDYKGKATVVHGHVPYDEPRIANNVVAIDTGCVYGRKLTAYKWPEQEFVSVPARATYYARKANPEQLEGAENGNDQEAGPSL